MEVDGGGDAPRVYRDKLKGMAGVIPEHPMKFSMRFCPKCGDELIMAKVGVREVQSCPSCNYVNWENPAPVATGVLIRNEKIVLVRARTRGDEWGLPSGFVEWDESAETAFRREIKEETNIDAMIRGFLGTYAIDNGRKKILLLAFEAEAKGGEFESDGEISEVDEFEPLAALELVKGEEEKIIIEKWLEGRNIDRAQKSY
jgi:NADH pyrophosphatase NudC (nudix superfamily)